MSLFRRLNRPSDTSLRIAIALVLIVFAVASRIVPHPANVAPIAAVALLGGAVLPRAWALTLPLAAMMVSDLIIGVHPTIFFTWGSFLVIAYGAHRYLKQVRVGSVIVASLCASLLFYLVSNFGVWLEGRLYVQTLEGLAQSYMNALPFFRNTIIGDMLFSAVLFGAYAAASSAVVSGYERIAPNAHSGR